MIRAGIIGGSNPMAGELIRLLINHPDIEIMWVNSARYAGRLVSDVHHGLVGETELRISPTANLDNINVLFIFRHKGQTIEWLSERVLPAELRIIDLSVDMQDPTLAVEHGFVYGLPELNRKVMVRGAQRAIVPHPIASIVSLCLMPMAKEQALDGNISINIYGATSGEKLECSEEMPDDVLVREISSAMCELQPAFSEPMAITTTPDTYARAISAEVKMTTDLDIGNLVRMYEEFYDDHNFVHIINTPALDHKEVEGTNKCLIHVDKQDGQMVVTAIMDAVIKGGAGTAVHDMNLLFGLYELTGLQLKASNF